MTAPTAGCRRCGASLAGERVDACFCSASCRNVSHCKQLGRCDEIPSGFLIDKAMRDASVESDILNPQFEGDPANASTSSDGVFSRTCVCLAAGQ